MDKITSDFRCYYCLSIYILGCKLNYCLYYLDLNPFPGPSDFFWAIWLISSLMNWSQTLEIMVWAISTQIYQKGKIVLQILLFYSFNSNSMPLSLEKIENLDCYNVIVIVIMLFSLKTREKKFQPFHLVGKSASCKTLMTSGFNPYYGNKLNIKRLGLCDTSANYHI